MSEYMGMNVESPFENEETLKKLLDMWAESPGMIAGDDLYSRVAARGEKSEGDDERDVYINKFDKYIKTPLYIDGYKYLKKILNDPKAHQYMEQHYQEKLKEMNPNDKYASIKNDFWTFLKRGEDAIQSYSNYEEANNRGLEIERSKYDLGYTEEEEKELRSWSFMNRALGEIFDGGKGIMGFHVNPQKLGDERERIHGTYKFYLNAGSDSYEVAAKLKEMYEASGQNFYFKVVNPHDYEQYRSDKICVYMDNEEQIQTTAKMLEQIKQENPQIKFQDPPILASKINGFIGFGSDKLLEGKSSYNKKMCKIIEGIFEQEFPDIDDSDSTKAKSEIQKVINEHPEKMTQIRDKIIQAAIDKGLPPEMIGVKGKEYKKTETKTDQSNPKTAETGNYLKLEATQDEIDRFSNLVNKGYEEDSKEMRSFYEQVAKERQARLKGRQNNGNEKKGELQMNNEGIKNGEEMTEIELREFQKKLFNAYKTLEDRSSFDARVHNEELYMNRVSKAIKGEFDNDPQQMKISKGQGHNEYGDPVEKGEFSYESIGRMCQYLAAARNMYIPGRKDKYGKEINPIKDLCTIPYMRTALTEMSKSPEVNDFLNKAKYYQDRNYTRAEGLGESLGLTPAEKGKQNALKYLGEFNDESEKESRINDAGAIQKCYGSYNEASLGKIVRTVDDPSTFHNIIKTEHDGYMLQNTREPQRENKPVKVQNKISYDNIKKDLIFAGINFSEIKRAFKEFGQNIKGAIRGNSRDDEDRNR